MAGKRQVLLGRTNNRRSELQSVFKHDSFSFSAIRGVYERSRAGFVERIFVGVASGFDGLADIRYSVLSENRDDGSWDTSETTETATERPERSAEGTSPRRAARTDEETRDGEMERHDEFFPTAESASLFDK